MYLQELVHLHFEVLTQKLILPEVRFCPKFVSHLVGVHVLGVVAEESVDRSEAAIVLLRPTEDFTASETGNATNLVTRGIVREELMIIDWSNVNK